MLDTIRYTADGATGWINPRYVEEVVLRETNVSVRLTSGASRTILFASTLEAVDAANRINNLVSRSIPT
jgi:hypothetical protein